MAKSKVGLANNLEDFYLIHQLIPFFEVPIGKELCETSSGHGKPDGKTNRFNCKDSKRTERTTTTTKGFKRL